MKRIVTLLLILLPLQSLFCQEYEDSNHEECTSIVVGRLASSDGSVITSHTCDGVSHTWISLEPAASHKKGETFKVYKGTRHTKFRGDTTGVKLVGEIPEVRHTYAYVNTGYPSLNEKQLAIGETTFGGPDTLKNPDSMFLIEELARLALMRCDNARDAVRLMGSIAEKYGYGDAGECLTVADKKEAWFFEILGVGKGKTGAVWAAQRVPDDEVAISANIPRIGKIDRKNKDYFMCSDNVESVALEYGLWDGKEELVFWKAYNVPRAKGRNYQIREYFVLSNLAPSLGLNMDMEELPFSVKPEKPVDVRDVMAFFRSTYEGTEHDMSKNIVTLDKDSTRVISPIAHNWTTATTRNTINAIAPGTIDFCRTLAVAWCSYSTVLQLRDWLPDSIGGILWYSVDNPAESPRIPIFCGNTSLPAAFDFCGQKQYKADCILWQFRRANRLATVGWQKDRKKIEKNIAEMEDMAFEGLGTLTADPAVLNTYTAKIYEEAAARWSRMEEEFWMTHGRGF